MKSRTVIGCAAILTTIAALFAAELGAPRGVTAHEWGTFTSVADSAGNPVTWSPLEVADDLPDFVHRFGGLRDLKGLQCTVRMETPVLYFYSAAPATLSVRVAMPRGLITEWYPRAVAGTSGGDPLRSTGWNGRIAWDSVRVEPGVEGPYPHEGKANHYYAARNTDSAAVRSGGEVEKLLFYRGVGMLPVSVHPRFTAEGKLDVRTEAPVSFLAWFENRDGKTGFRVIRDARTTLTLDPRELTGNVEQLHSDLHAALVSAGLYPKEAAAMIETWRDSWFEEGSRLVYVVPRAEVDRLLPIAIDPTPAALERVFVARIELLSPERRHRIESALADGNVAVLKQHRRFINPFLGLIARERGTKPAISPAAQAYLQQIWSAPRRP